MAFKVEDGTGLPDATSYVSVADATTYFTATNRATEWNTLTVAAQEAALNVGSRYADLRWGPRLAGQPLKTDQALEFPRKNLFDRYHRRITGVPKNWKDAVCEYTLQSLSGSLMPTGSSSSAAETKRKKIVVGPITTETEYFTATSSGSFESYPLGDLLVTGYLVGGNGGRGRVIRA